MFIRVKNISGKQYGYLVENTWKDGRARQKVRKYLGRVIEPEPRDRQKFGDWKDIQLEPYVSNTPFRQIIKDIIRYETEMHDLPGSLAVTKDGAVKKGKQEVILALNEGHLCRYTAKQLLNAKPVEEERRGEHLAEMLTRAGMKTEKELFILLYRKLYNI